MKSTAKITEADVTKAVRQLLQALGIWHWKAWQGPMSQPRGVSDLLGCYQGRMIAIEIKRPGRKPTPDQERFLECVRSEGGIAFWADSVDTVIEQLGLEGIRLI